MGIGSRLFLFFSWVSLRVFPIFLRDPFLLCCCGQTGCLATCGGGSLSLFGGFGWGIIGLFLLGYSLSHLFRLPIFKGFFGFAR